MASLVARGVNSDTIPIRKQGCTGGILGCTRSNYRLLRVQPKIPPVQPCI